MIISYFEDFQKLIANIISKFKIHDREIYPSDIYSKIILIHSFFCSYKTIC